MLIKDVHWQRQKFSTTAKNKQYAGRFPELNKHHFKYHYAHDITRVMIMIQKIRDKFPITRKV